jgi:hypothetical protein
VTGPILQERWIPCHNGPDALSLAAATPSWCFYGSHSRPSTTLPICKVGFVSTGLVRRGQQGTLHGRRSSSARVSRSA